MRITLLTLTLFLFIISPLFSQQNDSRYDLELNNVSFEEFVIKMEQQSKVHFFYDEQLLAGFRVSITVKNRNPNEILRAVFRNTDFRYAIDNDGNIFITRRTALLTKPAWDASPEDSLDYGDELIATDNRVYTIGIKTNVTPKGKALITGIVKDAVTGLPIANARILADKDQRGVTTNSSGRFSIELNKGMHELSISADNKTPLKRMVDLYNDGSLSFQLKDEIKVLSEVIITARRNSIVNRPQMGIERLNLRTIKQIPAAFGEADVLKAILTLPGVKTVGEASAGFNVRGGAADQNLILFNDATIYNPTHFFGLFSSFNPELIKDVELYKSSIPVKYGGRLSSVLNVTAKEGDKSKITGSAGIGLLTSRLNIEGPLVKDKTSFTLGGRTTYSNWLLKMLPDNSEFENSQASFYDINAGVHHIINKNNEVQFTGYYSKDDFNLNSDTTFGYSNMNMTLKWRHTFSGKMNADFVTGYDRYSYFNSSDEIPSNAYKMAFDINQLHAKADFNYYVNPLHSLEFGASTILYKIHPGNFTPEDEQSLVQEKIIREEQALETSVYAGSKYDLSDRLSVQAGIRYNIFNFLGPNSVNYYTQGIPKDESSFIESKEFGSGKLIKTYHGPEFRASMRYSLKDDLSIKASVNTTRQNIHMLSNTTAISPTDIWKLSDPNIRPQQGSQFSVGIYKNIFSDSIEVSVEGYYKRIRNYLDYRSGATLVLNETIERDVVSTKGKAYGVEFLLRKKTGKLNGWLSYTYSRTLLQMKDDQAGIVINRGEWYPSNYDKPHDATLVGNYRINLRFSMSLNVTYSTGRPITLPVGSYWYAGSERALYSDRNAYRIPDYFRTDFAINVDGNHKVRQRTHNSWTFGVYNLTGRKNPYSVYFNSEAGVTKGYKLFIFGSVIPFVNFNIRF
jgi:hypothetical protein